MSEVSFLARPYEPSKTAIKLHSAHHDVKIIAGPVGGGKTVACCVDLWVRALAQPADRFGKRKSYIMLVRDSLKNLQGTTLRTWEEWIPKEFKVADTKQPIYKKYVVPMPDGTTAEVEVGGFHFSDDSAIASMRSTEFTFAYLNEVQTMDWEAVKYCMSLDRMRYPSKADAKYPDEWVDEDGVLLPKYRTEFTGALLPEYAELLNPAPERGVVMDFNLTSVDHPVYKLCMNPPDGVMYYEQPPALICDKFDDYEEFGGTHDYADFRPHPDAENLHNLTDQNYYRKQVTSKSWAAVKRDLLMVWASVEDGVRVHKEFKRRVHVKSHVEVTRGAETVIGFDTSGMNPAAVIAQVVGGTVYVTDTLFHPDTSLTEFNDTMLMPLLRNRYYDCNIRVYCDPSGPRGGINNLKPYAQLQAQGLNAQIAPTNAIDQRIAAVAKMLTRVDGFYVGEKEAVLIKGLEQTYIYRRLRQGGGVQTLPDKNCLEGHLCDALQYLALGVTAHYGGKKHIVKPFVKKKFI